MSARAPQQVRSFKPYLEILEDRIVPSAPTLTIPLSSSVMEGATATVSIGASGGNGNALVFSMSGAPLGETINPSTGVIGGPVAYNNATSGTTATIRANISVTDGTDTTTGTLTCFVGDINRMPSVSTQFGYEGSTVSLNAQATDNISGDTLSYSASGLPTGLSINATGTIVGVIGFHNATNSLTATTFVPTITLTDQNGAEDFRSFTYSVSNTNVMAFGSSWSGSEGGTVSLDAAGLGAPTTGLTWTASGLPHGATINPTTGHIGGIAGYDNATPGTTATITGTVTASDSTGPFQSQTYAFTVGYTNRLPSPSAQSNTEGQTVSLSMQGTDNTGTDTLSYSASGLPDGLSIDPNTGLINGFIAFDNVTVGTTATFTPTVTLTDQNSATDTRNLTWTVTLASLTANPDSYSQPFNTTLTVAPGSGVLANDRTATTHSLTASLGTGPTHGTLTLHSDGSFVYVPNANYTGADSFTYTLTDSVNTTTGTVSLSITDSHTPVAVGDSYSMVHDAVFIAYAGIGVLANDSDGDPTDLLLATLNAGVSHGTLTLDGDGSFQYTPSAGFVGTDSFTYHASDGVLSSNTVTVTLSVTDTAPVASNATFGVQPSQALTVTPAWGVLSNATDADGDSLTAALGTGPSHGTVTLHSDGSFVYTGTSGYTGADSFTFTVSDGALSSTATVHLSIHASNAAPVANNDTLSVQHDQTLTVGGTGVLGNDTDANSDLLTASLVAGPSHGTLTLNGDGSLVYTPNAGYTGSDSFTYQASDGLASSGTATVSIGVTNSTTPTAVGYTFGVERNNPLQLNAASGVLSGDTDADGDVLTASVVSGVSHGTLTLNGDGSLLYTPNTNYTGTDTFVYSASDGIASSSNQTVTLSITASAPNANDDTYSVLKNTTLSVAASMGALSNDSDPDSLSLTASLASGPSHGAVTVNSDGSFSYTPTTNYTGADSFTYTASDGTLSTTATVSITVKATNSAPTATNLTYTLAHDSGMSTDSGTGVLSGATDSDNDPLYATLVGGPSHGTLTFNNDGSFDYTPSAGDAGVDSFTFQVFDGTTLSGTATATLSVTNGAPTVSAGIFSVANSGATTVSADNGALATATDPEFDPLTASLVSGVSHGTLTFNSDGSFVYTPGGGFTGSDSFTYTASDGVNTGNTATITLTTAPVASDETYDVIHDTPLSVSADGGVLTGVTDANSSSLTASLGTGPSHGTLTLNSDGSFVYTPNALYTGTDSFTYTASDGTNVSGTATVTLSITETAPVAYDTSFSAVENTPLSVAASVGLLSNASDPDGTPLTVQVLSDPSQGALAWSADGGFIYTPNSNFIGIDSFTYTVGDGIQSSGTVTATIEVNELIPDTSPSGVPTAVATGDFNGDGYADVVAVDEGSNTVEVYLNSGGVISTTPYWSATVGTAPVAVVVGDFNGDGKLDIAVANSGSNTVSIFKGNGDGTFTPEGTISTGTTPVALAVGKFNGDSNLDLAVVNEGDGTVSIFKGNGDFTFQTPTVISTGSGADAIAVADLNNDGVPDLVVANKNANTVTVLLGSSSTHSFSSAGNISVGTAPTAVAVGDFDGDGKVDLAVANSGDGTVGVYYGNGDGTFSGPSTYYVGNNPVALAVGDFYDDGYLDISVACKGDNTVWTLSNDGTGNFVLGSQTTPDAGPNSPKRSESAAFQRDSGDGVAVTLKHLETSGE